MSSLKGKVYCSFGYNAANWIAGLGLEITSNIQEADVVCFAGGQDIDTRFYNEAVGRHTGRPGQRDIREQQDFNIAVETGKKVVGVCRGGQLICALSGGKLIQHVEGHHSEHSISTYDETQLRVNSIHHQMMYPYDIPRTDYKVLAWSSRPLSSTYLDGHNRENWLPNYFKETEIVHFKKTRGLAIQFHPEMMYGNDRYKASNDWVAQLFTKFYHDEL